MSMFQCEVCGCRENTAYAMQGFRGITECYDWSYAPERAGLLLCSACGPALEANGSPSGFGQWHGKFERVYLPMGMFMRNHRGNLAHIETGSEDFLAYALPAPECV